MAGQKIPVSQYLKGYNSQEKRDFYRESAGVVYQDIWVEGPTRENGKKMEIQGEQRDVPVYELTTYDFDRWCAVNSSAIVINNRSAGFSQYINLDGAELDAPWEELDALRRGICKGIDPEINPFYLDQESYIQVAEKDDSLRTGFLLAETADAADWQGTQEEAILTLQIWKNCWMRIEAVRADKPVELPWNVDICFAQKQIDSLRAGLDFFTQYLVRVLPAPVLSMMNVSVGVPARGNRWDDAACKIFIDGETLSEQDRKRTFIVDRDEATGVWRMVAPSKAEETLQPWEKELVKYLTKRQTPRYYQAMAQRMQQLQETPASQELAGKHFVRVLADFDVLRWCMRLELFLKEIKEQENPDYETFIQANQLLNQLTWKLQEYGFAVEQTHALLRLLEGDFADGAKRFKGELEYDEYSDLTVLYHEIEGKDAQLAAQVREVLSSQYTAKGYEEDEISEKIVDLTEDEAVKNCPAIYFGVAKCAIETGTYVEKMKSLQQYVTDPAEKKDLSEQERALIEAFLQKTEDKKDAISHEEFCWWLGQYDRAEKSNAATARSIREMLTRQAELIQRQKLREYIRRLEQQGLNELETALTEAFLQRIENENNSIGEEEYRWWLEQYARAEKSNAATAKDIREMLTRQAGYIQWQNLHQHIEEAEQQGLSELETALTERILQEISREGAQISKEEYRWWLSQYARAIFSDKSTAQGIFEMLTHVRLKDEGDSLTLALESEQWRVLEQLVLQKAGEQPPRMSDDEYEKWIQIYKGLSSSYAGIDLKAVEMCETLLGKNISHETLELLRKNDVQGEFYWRVMGELLEQEKSRSMTETTFRTWMKYLAEDDLGEGLRRQIRTVLGNQRLLRTENGMVEALDVMRKEGNADEELQAALIHGEFNVLTARGVFQNVESLQRFLGHYTFLSNIGDEPFAKQILERICQSPVIGGRYILKTVLDSGCMEAELPLLQKEKNAITAYTPEEYEQRLERYFGNQYTDEYLSVLTAHNKGERAGKVAAVLAYIREKSLPRDKEYACGELLQLLTDTGFQWKRDLLEKLRELCKGERMQAVLQQNPKLLDTVVQGCLREKLELKEAVCFTRLLSERNAEFDDLAENELASAITTGDVDYDTTLFMAHFRNKIESDTSRRIGQKVLSRIQLSGGMDGETIRKAMELLQKVSLEASDLMRIYAAMASNGENTPLPKEMLEVALRQKGPEQAILAKGVAKWMEKARQRQEKDTLDALVSFMEKMNPAAFREQSNELFRGVCAFVSHENDISAVTQKTYERICKLWKDTEQEAMDEIRYPLLNASENLKGERVELLTQRMQAGVVPIDGRFKTLIDCRSLLERKMLEDAVARCETLDQIRDVLQGEALPWLDDETFARIFEADVEIPGQVQSIVSREVSALAEKLRNDDAKTPILNALEAMQHRVEELFQFRARTCVQTALKKEIDSQTQAAFKECVLAFDGQAGEESWRAMERMKNLLIWSGESNAKTPRTFTSKTLDWCARYANGVLNGWNDNRLITEIRGDRQDFVSLRTYVNRVYAKALERQEPSPTREYALMAAAKVLDIGQVWNTYLKLSMCMPLEKERIWTGGQESLMVMNVVYVYGLLPEVSDEIVSQDTLAEFCNADPEFSNQQKKLHNKELRNILDRARNGREKRTLFGLFRK
ncbi:MAG: hypothetical protein Q4C31_04110 [Eubacteriales bacterium]|nr:hypothetical protein [Eubacteriales bacterium]